jgi:hypothetical protein
MPLVTIEPFKTNSETMLIFLFSSSSLLVMSSFIEEKEGASFEAFRLWGLVAFTAYPGFPAWKEKVHSSAKPRGA